TIIGQQVGFSDKQTGLSEFISDLFLTNQSQKSKEFVLNIGSEKRHYYIIANKYNHDTEAVIFGLDLTQYQRAYQELLASKEQSKHMTKLASLGEIVSKVSDEINTPTLSLKEKIEELKAESYPNHEEKLKLIDDIYKEAAKLNKQSYFLKQLSSKEKENAWKKILVSDLLNAVLMFCSEQFKAAHVSLSIEDYPKDLTIFCLFNQFLEVILNLVNNALDAVSSLPNPSTQWVKINIVKGEFGIEITVIDSGKGVPCDQKENIFQPFFTTASGKTGSGFGLFNARGIIEKHGGILTLDENSTNTKFVISLPIDIQHGKPTNLEEVLKAA
ncbi:MAG: HAMP domain-containing histidine kinase, partial [Bdellovibrio sp.]|nr:HAMP domain-containing histidine kinase [Bdellovibrio sp.]